MERIGRDPSFKFSRSILAGALFVLFSTISAGSVSVVSAGGEAGRGSGKGSMSFVFGRPLRALEAKGASCLMKAGLHRVHD